MNTTNKTEHFLISGHGFLTIEQTKIVSKYKGVPDIYEATNLDTLEMPKNTRLVMYNPPGVIMLAKSGGAITKWLAQNLDDFEEAKLNSLSEGILYKKENRGDSPRKAWFYHYHYDQEKVRQQYPKVLPPDPNGEIYNYLIKGPKSEDERAFYQDLTWGISQYKNQQWVTLQDSKNGQELGTLHELIDNLAPSDPGVTRYIHLICCRVEIIKGDYVDYLDESVKTHQLHVMGYNIPG